MVCYFLIIAITYTIFGYRDSVIHGRKAYIGLYSSRGYRVLENLSIKLNIKFLLTSFYFTEVSSFAQHFIMRNEHTKEIRMPTNQ